VPDGLRLRIAPRLLLGLALRVRRLLQLPIQLAHDGTKVAVLVVNPGTEPPADITTAGDRREVVELQEQSFLRQDLQHA
jgi:hypothetical protein